MAVKNVKVRSENLNKNNEHLNLEDLFKINKEDMFFGSFNYFYYPGSLTSPPCDGFIYVYCFVVSF